MKSYILIFLLPLVSISCMFFRIGHKVMPVAIPVITIENSTATIMWQEIKGDFNFEVKVFTYSEYTNYIRSGFTPVYAWLYSYGDAKYVVQDIYGNECVISNLNVDEYICYVYTHRHPPGESYDGTPVLALGSSSISAPVRFRIE